MLSAYPNLQSWLGLPPPLDGQPDQHPHPRPVDRIEWALLEDAELQVLRDELGFDVVPAEAEGGLREIVGPKGEEIGMSCDLPGGQGGPRGFDHRSHLVRDLRTRLPEELLCRVIYHLPEITEFPGESNQWDHDFHPRRLGLFRHVDGCL